MFCPQSAGQGKRSYECPKVGRSGIFKINNKLRYYFFFGAHIRPMIASQFSRDL